MSEASAEFVVIVRGTDVLVDHSSGTPGLYLCPRNTVLRYGTTPIFVDSREGVTWYAAPALPDVTLPIELSFRPVRALFAELPEATLHRVGRAIACVEFEQNHRFCGRCAAATTPDLAAANEPNERVRVCPSCGLTFHPRIPPAVIVLVERDDRLLLARGANFPAGRFSAVAGFVEIGESLEDAARREVQEEVGIRIANLRYFSSQPWPFGHSLMIGFHARYESGELRPDGVEIVEADWFRRDALPQLPPPISIARRLIENFLAQPGVSQ
ncbi:MAG TPA: NAD(+) diphosphatase [Polyangiaceae bacterium]|nr:NAD(+) diphosphatase [Polyangiaceae bacterium]